MSRAYRIRVGASVTRVIRGEDHVSCQLEVLEILPKEAMAELLAQELINDGFQREGDLLIRKQGNITIEVDAQTAVVTVRVEQSEEVTLESARDGYVIEEELDQKEKHEQALEEELQKQLNKDIDREEQKLVQEATDELERHLGDIKGQLDQAVNRATAGALKQKAKQLGQIKEMTEDAATGSLTIVVEV